MFELHGIVPPLVTPLRDDETVDEEVLERLVRRLVDAGVHGLFVLGSTGEQPALRGPQREAVLRTARRAAGDGFPLIVGTMAASTARAIDNIRAAEAGGASAVAVTPPHYYPSQGRPEQVAHYQACVAATGLPVVIYNIPSTTKVNLAPETMAQIAEAERVVGIKDSSGDFVQFLKILGLVRDREGFGTMVGSPYLAGPAMLYGAEGAVPGIANIDPRLMLDVYASAVARNIPTLERLQDRVHALMSITTLGAPIVCIKTAMELQGLCSSRAAAPLQPLRSPQREAIRQVLHDLSLLPEA
jgi:dihydrodipicolinate synthase/N-acetylneuraminate lyase